MDNKIRLILGTMNFGPQINANESREMVQRFIDHGYFEMDTAYVYNDGKTEQILGLILPEFENNNLSIATKVHPRITGKLDSEAVNFQFNESIMRMNRSKVDILYLHFPDLHTPIEEALEACAILYNQGKFNELGLSNFPAWMVLDVWHICDKKGWPKPTVYQGMYNGLCRNVEPELFPAIRKLGIRFYAFNPLAGGMLSGKYTNFREGPKSGRFERLQSYRKRYWKKSYFDAVKILIEKCLREGVEPVEAAYRWLSNHSFLDKNKGDGIIIGASSINQFEQNITSVKVERLPESIIEAFNIAWEVARPESPNYFKFYIDQ